jgi:hypothetical protein
LAWRKRAPRPAGGCRHGEDQVFQIASAFGVLLLAGTAAAPDFARQNYRLDCAGCHFPAGTGSAPNDVPTLHRIPGEFIKGPSGCEFLAQVPRIVCSPLSSAEGPEILNYVLYRYNGAVLPDGFAPYTAAEVAGYRAVKLASIMKVRERVIADLAARGILVRCHAQ